MRLILRVWLLLIVFPAMPVSAIDEFEQDPIQYSSRTPENPVSRFQSQLEDGTVTLTYDPEFGFLKSLLDQLHVPLDSQMLVFSKTSLQIGRISPRTPRALYFNDDIYVGYAQGGDLIELSVVDPQLGTVFYTLEQNAEEPPLLMRQGDRCLTCHASTRTENVPGHLARSLHVDRRGHPIFSAGSKNVDHRTPLADRWGGWYVTGTHGEQTHLGNLIAGTRAAAEPVDNSAGHNVTSLEERFQLERYLTPHSDLVALMVFEHQLYVHNRLTKSAFNSRSALHYRTTMTAALGKSSDSIEQSVQRRIQNAAEELIDAILLVDEAPLTQPVQGTSGFSKRFSEEGPRDSQGRSLKQLDLQKRLFRYPCSYVIYSDAFDALPPELLSVFWDRLHVILSGNSESPKYEHLTAEDRAAILQILLETKSHLPESWRS